MILGERLNTYTHLTGTALAVLGTALLITHAAQSSDVWRVVSFSIYGATLVALFGASTLYHASEGSRKVILQKLDHCAIYLLIAGTYTPFTLVSLSGAWGWSLFGVVWALAVLGIVQELWLGRGARKLSLAIYVVMGWIVIIGVVPMLNAITWRGMLWIFAGGVVYTGGIFFYIYDKKHPGQHWHGVWHVFVLAAAAIHFAAICLFVA